jgi:hypothetical protein
VGIKGLNANDIHKEMFSVCGEKCLWRKQFTTGVKCFADDEEVETEVRKWLRQQSKDFYSADFDAMAKRWDKCIIVGGGYVEEKNAFLSRSEYHMFYVLHPFVTYLLTLSRIYLLMDAVSNSNYTA